MAPHSATVSDVYREECHLLKFRWIILACKTAIRLFPRRTLKQSIFSYRAYFPFSLLITSKCFVFLMKKIFKQKGKNVSLLEYCFKNTNQVVSISVCQESTAVEINKASWVELKTWNAKSLPFKTWNTEQTFSIWSSRPPLLFFLLWIYKPPVTQHVYPNKNPASARSSWALWASPQPFSLFTFIFLPFSCSLLEMRLGFSWEKVTVRPIKENYEEVLDASELSVILAFHYNLLWHLHGVSFPNSHK